MNLKPTIFLLLLLLAGCAKQTTPTGGEKDEIPPRLVRSNPPDRQTNFTKNELELYFDEFVQVNSPREQIIITPSIGKKFEAEARKNRVILKLNSELKENTTYTVMFREAIQDLTERNPAENLKIAFSTGNLIDSLSITGTVSSLLQDKPLKNYTVALIPYHDTVNIFKHEAQWITITNGKGEYELNNLKKGDYLLYAFDDKNKNLIVDSRTEAFAFKAQPVQLDSAITNLSLKTVQLDSRDFKVISARPIARYFNIRLTKGIAEYKAKPIADSLEFNANLEDPSTLRIYNTFPELDSAAIHFQFTDSTMNVIDTTVYVRFDTRTTTTEDFNVKVDRCEYLKNKSLLKVEISASKPTAFIETDSIYIQLDSVNRITFNQENIKLSADKRKIYIDKTLSNQTDFTEKPSTGKITRQRSETKDVKEDTNEKKIIPLNKLILTKGAMISIESDSSKEIQSAIKTITPENSGTIYVSVKTDDHILVQIIDKSFNVVQQSDTKETKFDNLPPADYYIRIILDKNNNGKWDAGNFFKRTEPEPVIFWKSEKGIPAISLKANWEVGPLLITP